MTFHDTAFFRRVTAISMKHAVLSSGSKFETISSFPFLRDWLVVIERKLLFNPIGVLLREL